MRTLDEQRLTTHEKRLTNSDSRTATHEQRLTNSDSRTATHEQRLTNNDSRTTTHEQRLTNNPLVTDHYLRNNPMCYHINDKSNQTSYECSVDSNKL